MEYQVSLGIARQATCSPWTMDVGIRANKLGNVKPFMPFDFAQESVRQARHERLNLTAVRRELAYPSSESLTSPRQRAARRPCRSSPK